MPPRFALLILPLFTLACAPHAPRAAQPGSLAFTPNGQGWIDLEPGMGLRVENAYFREGSAKHTVDEFIGTEAAEYTADPRGRLTVAELQSKVARRPADQAPVQTLIPESLARLRFHRFFYQVVFNRSTRQMSGAVLLGARSAAELASLGAKVFADPDSVCGPHASGCAVFPELCSVSVQMAIVVNGEARRVLWRSTLASVAPRPTTVEVLRLQEGRPTPLAIDLTNPAALRVVLLPGDRVTWR